MILTGLPRGGWAEAQKRRWAGLHFPGVKVITTTAAFKREHCRPGDALADKYRHLWERPARGRLHASPERSKLCCDRFGDSKVILLGESTHGTDEFYRARAAITERLVLEHGFNIVALEADWPDAARIDAYVRGHPELPSPTTLSAVSHLDVAQSRGPRLRGPAA